MSKPLVFTLTTALALAGAAGASSQEAQQDDLRREIEALKQGQVEIQKQLTAIQKLLAENQPPPPPRPVGPAVRGKVFDLGANPIKGDAGARLTLIEFTDYQCPYCSRHVRETMPQIEREYIESGKLRYVMLDLPLERIHPLAFKAAEAAHCAGDQGKYWEMHDRLFEHQKALEPWSDHAAVLDLDVAAFNACMEGGTHGDAVRKDMSEARKAGATGTPSFVLAATDPDDADRARGLSFLRGAQPFAAFKTEIDKALAESAKKEPPSNVE